MAWWGALIATKYWVDCLAGNDLGLTDYGALNYNLKADNGATFSSKLIPKGCYERLETIIKLTVDPFPTYSHFLRLEVNKTPIQKSSPLEIKITKIVS